MKKIFLWMLIALVGIAFSSCEGFNKKQTEFFLKDLQGYWLEDGTQVHARYTTESAGTIKDLAYLWGYSWDEADDVMEEDPLPYGHGWFKYELKTSGTLTEIHLMDNGDAEIPKVFIVSKLTESALEYYEKDRSSSKFYFSKVVEKK